MSADSVTDVCNMALSQIGVELISDVSEDSLEARMCNARHADLRDACLRAHPWNFATTFAKIAKTTNTPAWRWSYEYVLPADCLRVLELYDIRDQYEIVSNRRLYSNHDSPLKVKYTAQVTDPSLMDISFKQAWATLLAAELALAVSRDSKRAQALHGLYREKLADARFYESTEKGPEQFAVGTYLDARQGGPFTVDTRIPY